MISALLAALVGGELVSAVLAAVGITGRAAVAAKIGLQVAPKILPKVVEGVRKLRDRPDLTPEERAAVDQMQSRALRDLAGNWS